jgi:hypothetical protein
MRRKVKEGGTKGFVINLAADLNASVDGIIRTKKGSSIADAQRQEVSMTPEEKASPEAAAAMHDFMAGIRSHAHFRYPVDGQWSEIEKAVNAGIDDIFGPESPNSAQNRWVRKLRHFGLIR